MKIQVLISIKSSFRIISKPKKKNTNGQNTRKYVRSAGCKIECYGTYNKKPLGEFRESLVYKILQLRCNGQMNGKEILILYIMYNGGGIVRKVENSGRKKVCAKYLQ